MPQQSHYWALYPNKTITEKDTCTPMLIAALFRVARTWKQPRYPSINEWIKNLRYVCVYIYIYIYIYTHTHNGILPNHIKEWNNAICCNMNGPRDYHTKRSKWGKERQIPCDTTYMWNLKHGTGRPWWYSAQESSCHCRGWVQSLVQKDSTYHRATNPCSTATEADTL